MEIAAIIASIAAAILACSKLIAAVVELRTQNQKMQAMNQATENRSRTPWWKDRVLRGAVLDFGTSMGGLVVLFLVSAMPGPLTNQTFAMGAMGAAFIVVGSLRLKL